MCAIRIHIHTHTDRYTQSYTQGAQAAMEWYSKELKIREELQGEMHPRTQQVPRSMSHCNALQHTAMHCSMLLHTATQSSAQSHTATYGNTLQLAATHCNTLQYYFRLSLSLSHNHTHTHTLAHTTGAPHLHLSVGRKIARRTARRARGSRWHNGFQRQRVHLCRSVVLRVVACCCSVLSRAQRSRQHSDFSGRGYMRIALCCNVLLCVAISTKKSSTWRISESSRMSSP